MFFRKEDKGLNFELFMIQFFLGLLYGSIIYIYYLEKSYGLILVTFSIIIGMRFALVNHFERYIDTIKINFLPWLLLVMGSFSLMIILWLESGTIKEHPYTYGLLLILMIYSERRFYIAFRNNLKIQNY